MTSSLPKKRLRGSQATRELRFALASAVLLATALLALLILPRSKAEEPLPAPKPFPASLDVLPNPVALSTVDAQRKN